MPDIVDTAINAGNFDTLVIALVSAGLDTTLKSPGPFTVFAPTDEAFDKLQSETFAFLLEDINLLRKILSDHIVSGRVMAADVAKLKEVTTVSGSTLKIDATNGLKLNDATVVTPDFEAENGVIHVIDLVLMRQ